MMMMLVAHHEVMVVEDPVLLLHLLQLHQTWIQDGAVEGWKQFILEKSKGFTRAGAVRIDDSIRT